MTWVLVAGEILRDLQYLSMRLMMNSGICNQVWTHNFVHYGKTPRWGTHCDGKMNCIENAITWKIYI